MKVAVVGAGFGGLAAGLALQREGLSDFLIFEEAAEVGGVWRENTYPGCNCDVPAHLYSLAEAPYQGDVRYPGQRETLDYLRTVAREHGLMKHLRFNTAIAQADFDDKDATWTLVTADGHTIYAEIVIFAAGMLHRRYLPDIPGRDTFTGSWFHSAQWDHRRDFTGRRVAVIGTGASAAQVIPELAATAAHVEVFQRTPTWVLPKPRAQFSRPTRWALHRIPLAHRIYRAALYYAADLVLAPVMTNGWSARPAEWFARAYLRVQVRNSRLRAALTPRHRIGAKRIVLSKSYYRALGRDNVSVTTTAIGRVTESGIQTVDGAVHSADTIIYATGFRATEFLAPMVVTGRGGRVLHHYWDEGGATFLGLAVPGFPNAFIMAGPNTFNPAGSNVDMKQNQLRYIMAAIRLREQSGAAAIEVSDRSVGDYDQWLREAISRTVWPEGGSSWYKTDSGRVTNPWPSTARTYARMTRRDPALDFQPMSLNHPPQHPIEPETGPPSVPAAHPAAS
ncbi:NAD(P)/FAD-dependent oxidoreductase [Nocardia sp. CNY236]|uniref:flavin-containing monooxygenase n=1 Tax=Nocardia sp. CNY236 TaxID=1169152 RepID=UPI001E5ACCF4|nr:NAD(P)/FAD-dependent oxidoreductase [Nocardia sp. CNY236]